MDSRRKGRSFVRRMRVLPVLVLVLSGLAALQGALVLAQNNPPHFNVDPHSENVWGHEWTPNNAVQVFINSELVAEPLTDAFGNFGTGFDPAVRDIVSGDYVEVTDGSVTKGLSVTGIAITDVDVDNDTVSGVADGDHADVWVDESDVWRREVVAGGTWTANFGVPGTEGGEEATIDLTPGMHGGSNECDDDGDCTFAHWQSGERPHIHVNPLNDNILGGFWLPDTTLEITIDDPLTPEEPDHMVFWDTWGDGAFDFNLWDEFGINVEHDDVVTTADGISVADMIVVPVEVTSVDIDAATASGTSRPDEVIWVQVLMEDADGWRYTTANGAGVWSVDFRIPGTEDEDRVKVVLDHFEPGWTIRAHRYDFTNVPGAESNDNDASIHDWRIPNPTFSVDTPFDVWSTGEDWAEGTIVTVNIDDPSNGPGADYSDSTVVERWGPNPWEVGFNFHTEPFEIHPGFVVTAGDTSTVKTLEVVDITVETVDEVTDTVSGYAPPGERVEVHAGDEFSHAHRSVDADATTGYWMANFSVPGEEGHEQEILDIQPWVGGAAEVPDDDGDSTHQGWCFECEGPGPGPIEAEPGDVLISQTDGSLWVCDPATGDLTKYRYPFGGTWDIQWFDDDHVLIAHSGDARVWLLTLSSGDLELVAEGDPLGFPIGLALEDDGRTLWIADHEAGVLRMDMETGVIDRVVEPFAGAMDGIVVIGETVYFTDQSGTLWQVDYESPDHYSAVVDVGPYSLNGLVETPEGDILATATWPSALVTVDVDTWSFTIDDYSAEMRSSEDSAFTANGDIYVSDSGYVNEFGEDPGLYLLPVGTGVLQELHRGDPLGDIVDLLVVPETPPVVTNVLGDPNPAAVDTAITVSANVDDTSTGNSNITDAEYSLNGTAWADMAPSDMRFNSPTEDVEATLSGFSEAGVHEVCVRGTDAAGNTSSGEDCTLLAVYDPSAGFVTGGGWIWSEAGWCQLDEACAEAEGKANFGFVSKYKKGVSVPTGQTEFQFKAGDLNFHSSSYDWLVVAGANAKYKGVGTINGDGEYKFMLTATDADVNDNDSHQVDLFRIKIWYEADGSEVVVYDNQMGEPDDGYAGTAIGGGNIKVHNGK